MRRDPDNVETYPINIDDCRFFGNGFNSTRSVVLLYNINSVRSTVDQCLDKFICFSANYPLQFTDSFA
jgi:hypothetical protein